jgi:hypothetical protein
MAMTLTEHQKYADKTRSELIDEIIRLGGELRARNEEISLLKKKLSIYRSIK